MSNTSDSTNPPSHANGLSGRRLGDFQLLRRLGSGAMAEVYLAEQTTLRRHVAVKVLKPELAGDQTYLRRFEREAQAAASLVHGNIVQIYEVGRHEGVNYIAQEYVQGENLAQWVRRHGALDLRQAVSLMRQVAAALARAGEQGVVHRDVKPENIMLTRSGEVKVADFGLARVTRAGETSELTQAGITMGTPLYMSPEQVEGKPLDPRSDIYSFGATCYHVLAGSPPFRGESALGVAVQHIKTPPEPLENLRRDLPPALCRMVHRMLAKDPDNRYQSARELLGELRRLHAEHLGDNEWPEELAASQTPTVAFPLAPRQQATQRLGQLMDTIALSRPRPSRRWGWAAALVVAFGLGGLIAYVVGRESFLLAEAEAVAPAVPRAATALQQYLDACRIGTEEAFEAVGTHFPDKTYYIQLADQQLARIYLRRRDYAQALEKFQSLQRAAEAGSDKPLLAYALAGQCGTFTLLGRYEESDTVLTRLWPIRDTLEDAQMRSMLRYAVGKNRSELGPQSTHQWGDWLAEQFEPEPEPD
jgi:eukaryotic-like serine/threonine-protein kinase